MKALSMYSGECDGIGFAAEMAGIEVVAYCEANEKRRARLSEKHPGHKIFESDEEVTKSALDGIRLHPDIIFGGPPCQPFSVAGARRAEADPRHRWPQMRRIIHECRPRWVVVENVGGFVHLALDLVLADLENEDYEAGAVVLPALAVGAPHRRDRCFVVGHAQCGAMGHDVANGRTACPEEHTPANACAFVGMGDASRHGQTGDNGRRTGQEPANRHAAMAYAESAERDRAMPARDRRGGFADCGMEYTGRAGCEKYNPSAVTGGKGYLAGRPDPDEGTWTAQSGLGGVLDGISARLDEQMKRWPAWRGMEQYDWEPPRTSKAVKERTRRIESLGLAVVPWQVYPIFELIVQIDKMISVED